MVKIVPGLDLDPHCLHVHEPPPDPPATPDIHTIDRIPPYHHITTTNHVKPAPARVQVEVSRTHASTRTLPPITWGPSSAILRPPLAVPVWFQFQFQSQFRILHPGLSLSFIFPSYFRPRQHRRSPRHPAVAAVLCIALLVFSSVSDPQFRCRVAQLSPLTARFVCRCYSARPLTSSYDIHQAFLRETPPPLLFLISRKPPLTQEIPIFTHNGYVHQGMLALLDQSVPRCPRLAFASRLPTILLGWLCFPNCRPLRCRFVILYTSHTRRRTAHAVF